MLYNSTGKINNQDMMLKYMPLVKKVALSIHKKIQFTVELEELVQCGVIGLIDAFQKYVQMDSAKFETYATTRVKGSIIDELRRRDHLTQDDRQSYRLIELNTQKLEATLKRKPLDTEIAASCEITLPKYFEVLRRNNLFYFLSSQENEEETFAVIDESDSLEDKVYKKQLVNKIALHIDTLPENEKLIMHLIYVEDLDAKEVAYVMKITPARVSQLQSQAITRLKLSMASYA